jgi:hypothetical protein
VNTSGDEGSEEGGNADPHFDSLINLNAIAEKAKEAKLKKEEVLEQNKGDRWMRPIPFEIEGCWAGMKEDLNVVLHRESPIRTHEDYLVDEQVLRGSMVSGLSMKSRKSTAAKNQTLNHTQPLSSNIAAKPKPTFSLSPMPVPQDAESGLKQVLMYK